MSSLEKCMFFIPNRFFVDRNEMFVSFNIAPIPSDMEINRLTLHVPLGYIRTSTDSSLLIEEIETGWDVALLSQGFRPSHSKVVARVPIARPQEVTLDLNKYSSPWRFTSMNNHGFYVAILSESKLSFSEEAVPYLIAATI